MEMQIELVIELISGRLIHTVVFKPGEPIGGKLFWRRNYPLRNCGSAKKSSQLSLIFQLTKNAILYRGIYTQSNFPKLACLGCNHWILYPKAALLACVQIHFS